MNTISTSRLAGLAGAILCLTAVALGAFGAHALENILTMNERGSVYELASRYQFYHGLGLLVIAGLLKLYDEDQPVIVWTMLLGTLIFSGSLYLLAITNLGGFGAVTPIGGLLMIVAWVLLVRFTWRTL